MNHKGTKIFMKILTMLPILLTLVILTACSSSDRHLADTIPLTAEEVGQTPPVVEKRFYDVYAPGGTRLDEYYWLRDDTRQDPDMLSYLNAENAYADAVMVLLADFKNELYEEMVGRLQQDDTSAPYLYKEYWYYTRYEEGKEYPIHARRKGNMDAPEEIMLDLNELAEGTSYYSVDYFKISPDQKLLAFVEDSVGRRQYRLRIKNLETGIITDTGVSGISYAIAWAADNATIYYVENDPVTLLSKKVKYHTIGTDATTDPVV